MEEVTGRSFDLGELRNIFGSFPSGVTALCAMVDDVPVGMAASSFASVSMDPPLVSICVQNESRTWKRLQNSTSLGISVFAEAQREECLRMSLKEGDRFARVEWEQSGRGAVHLKNAAATLTCRLHSVVPAGDHGIALLRVDDASCDHDVDPLIFHRSMFRALQLLS
ncbi:flavin reductase (DIM6/NTAB) family NADH-FMN oxidoreductase RutF [Williamsia limnetica]|jgi:flavin reductase (DIM6/NTAB) family NADH-FMN oxidoreductase RutF|uniref:Flavin reductase family protein n=2 Tax=Mycobacteriales TaxID=85007 RepID=A0ABT4N207_GORRU|nr:MULTISPECIES: flavin reductase family protein [Mycobacteriales]MCZ4552451.1 flavin reductase family protein [Gordonia rubripertincta]PYE19323.1 flavin reductase (DIM6/NTAB) family NADH-FMN oxidoreductase RutF [Williamsia limnetica]